MIHLMVLPQDTILPKNSEKLNGRSIEQYLTAPWPPAPLTRSETLLPSSDRRWLMMVKPLPVGITLTEEWLNQAKEEGRE